MVIFDLKHPQGSGEAAAFLEDGERILTSIPSVRRFSAGGQISLKNDYQYVFTMDFKDEEDYRLYNEHSSHASFVKERWESEVSCFMEIDFLVPAGVGS
ncbi:Dabb family protein [Paenibacillus sp. RUD330]|nr:Dabb family protein [Paenibacillus sp. RUD330]